jgi:hypothetical protein
MVHLVIGLALAALGIWGVVAWWDVFGLVMRGLVPFTLLVFGLVALLSGYRQTAQLKRESSRPEPAPVGPRGSDVQVP